MELTPAVEALIRSPRADISPKEAAEALGYRSSYGFNIAAKQNKDIGFRYFWRGNHLRISKADVLAFLGWHWDDEKGWVQ